MTSPPPAIGGDIRRFFLRLRKSTAVLPLLCCAAFRCWDRAWWWSHDLACPGAFSCRLLLPGGEWA